MFHHVGVLVEIRGRIDTIPLLVKLRGGISGAMRGELPFQLLR